jgi:hypothetical protein
MKERPTMERDERDTAPAAAGPQQDLAEYFGFAQLEFGVHWLDGEIRRA